MKPVFAKTEDPNHAFLLMKRTNNPRPEFLWHFHHVHELNLVLKGRGTRFIGDNIAHYEEGDLVLMGPGLPHTWCTDPRLPRRAGPYESVAIQFSERFLGESLVTDPEWHHVRSLLKRAAQGVSFKGQVRDAVRTDILELNELTGPTKLIAFLQVLNALAHSDEYTVLSSPDYFPMLPSENENRIDRVCTYINRRYAEPLTQPDAAAVANMGVYAFSRFFKKTMGKSFKEYVVELRLGHACRLLIETDQSIAEIAYASGFNNLSNFNRRFLERKGVSPRVYRRSYLRS